MNHYRNRYYRRARISEREFRSFLKMFALDLTASDCARLTGLSVRTVNSLYLKIRRRLAAYCEAQSPFAGEVEVDESYFGPKRVPGNRGRGAGGKTIVFGIFKRNGFVYTEIVPDCRRRTLRQAIRGRVSLESIIHSDNRRGYDGLVDLGYAKHLRVNHTDNEFVRERAHVNGIEFFWSYAKRRLTKFNGVPRHTFYLHLKETEFRFNHRRGKHYGALLKLFRNDPLRGLSTS